MRRNRLWWMPVGPALILVAVSSCGTCAVVPPGDIHALLYVGSCFSAAALVAGTVMLRYLEGTL